jgi:hypothetical protein
MVAENNSFSTTEIFIRAENINFSDSKTIVSAENNSFRGIGTFVFSHHFRDNEIYYVGVSEINSEINSKTKNFTIGFKITKI